jgi:hypothetical protein
MFNKSRALWLGEGLALAGAVIAYAPSGMSLANEMGG